VWLQLIVEQEQLQKLMTAYDVIQDIDDDIDDEIVMVSLDDGRVSLFIFLRESRFYGSGVLVKVWDAEMREIYASHNLSALTTTSPFCGRG